MSYALVELKLEWDDVGEVCVQVCVSVKAKERPHLLLKSVNRVQAVAVSVWPLSLLLSLFAHSPVTNKQLSNSCVDLEPCKLPTLGHLPCTSHAENSRFYVKN